MKEKPILFSGPMVRAILDGRKTQTRRVVKPQPAYVNSLGIPFWPGGKGPVDYRLCPHGAEGDRLWVKETHRFDGIDQRIGVREKRIEELSYRADMEGDPSCDDCAWRPSIFMPRWASRITLEIVSVRVERLQDISEEDAIAEGVTVHMDAVITAATIPGVKGPAYLEYFDLWESINGPGSWDANPWVWVIEFKRIQP